MDAILADLFKKTRLQRDVHAFWEQRTKRMAKVYKTALISLSGVVTFLAFTDVRVMIDLIPRLDSSTVPLVIALCALALFLISIMVDVFRLTDNYIEHRRAVNRYTDLLRDLYIESHQFGSDGSFEVLRSLERRYRDISTSAIALTPREFDLGEKNYHRRQARRHVARTSPMAGFFERRRLQRRYLNDQTATPEVPPEYTAGESSSIPDEVSE